MNSISPAIRSPFLFRKTISISLTFLLMLLTGLSVYYFFPKPPAEILVKSGTVNCPQKIDEVRLKDYRFTHPLMLADLRNENEELSGLKEKIVQLVNGQKTAGLASDVSIYYRNMDDGSWFVVNGDRTYFPASLMKVSFLIAVLKQAGSNPGLLNKKIYFDKPYPTGFNQNIRSFTLKPGKYYSMKELLYDMIVYSDNDALTLVASNMDQKVFLKLFTDLGMTPPPLESAKYQTYQVKVADYCKLFGILYNSGYLTDENSEMALRMLSESKYKEGLLKEINPGFPVAHKFGERTGDNHFQLHEIGIFYAEPQPYLIGVMSEGANFNDLSTVLNQVSKLVFENYSKGI